MSKGAKLLGAVAACAVFAAANAMAAFMDESGNYGGVWNSGEGQGTGFGNWTLTADGGTGGYAGTFIGDPSDQVTGLGTSAFGLYAHSDAGAFAQADRSFLDPLGVGDIFSITWGFNWDSDTDGNKGLNLFAGTGEININNGGTAAITINGDPMFANYGQNAMTVNFEYVDATTVRVTANGRDGVEAFDDTFTVDGAPTGFRVYASNMSEGDERQPYFDDLTITPIPEPMSAGLLGLGVAMIYFLRRKVRK